MSQAKSELSLPLPRTEISVDVQAGPMGSIGGAGPAPGVWVSRLKARTLTSSAPALGRAAGTVCWDMPHGIARLRPGRRLAVRDQKRVTTTDNQRPVSAGHGHNSASDLHLVRRPDFLDTERV